MKYLFVILTVIVFTAADTSNAFATGDCTDYVDLTGMPLPISVAGMTTGATDDHQPFDFNSDPPECWEGPWSWGCGMGPDMTFKWTVPQDGNYTISLARSGYNANLFLYDFTCPVMPVYPDDYICGSQNNIVGAGLLSGLDLTAGQEILIVVDGFGNGSGDFELEILDQSGDLDAYLQWIMDVFHWPGMSVAVIKNAAIWTNVYGLANIEEERPVTDSTLFIVYSVSKTVTATALMQQWEDSRFDLDDAVNDHLVYEGQPFEVVHPLYPEFPITMRQALCHVASLTDRNLGETIVYGRNCEIELGEYMYERFTPGGVYYHPDNFFPWAPGTGWSYTNIGVTLVGYLVECVAPTATTFVEHCQERIFDPLNMPTSTFMLEHIDPGNLATEYTWVGGTHVPGEPGHATWYPAGALRSNAAELSRFLLAFMQGGEYGIPQLLEPATVDTMLTVQYPEIPAEPEGQGLLWRWEEIGGRELWGHLGGGTGARSGLWFSPTENIGVVVVNNCGNGGWPGIEFAVDALLDFAARDALVAAPDEDVGPPQLTRLNPCHPNPFNPLTTISFALEQAGRVEVAVYDLSGKRVTELADRTFATGEHSLQWNGRDSQGRAIPSGAYIVRLETDSGVEARKVMLVR